VPRQVEFDMNNYNNKYFKQITSEKQSGVPHNQHVQMAIARYELIEEKPFRFEHCIDVLMVKYNADEVELSDSADEGAEESRNVIRGVMGVTMERNMKRGWQ
jgi:hypothetical protein